MACHYAVRKGAQKRDEQDDPTDIESELAELLDGASVHTRPAHPAPSRGPVC